MESEKNGGGERVFMLLLGELDSELRFLLGGLESVWDHITGGYGGRASGLQGVMDCVIEAHCGECGVYEYDILFR